MFSLVVRKYLRLAAKPGSGLVIPRLQTGPPQALLTQGLVSAEQTASSYMPVGAAGGRHGVMVGPLSTQWPVLLGLTYMGSYVGFLCCLEA